MTRRLLLLIGGCLAFAAVGGVAARAVGGGDVAAYLITAVALCLVPAVATFVWAEWAFKEDPERMRLMVLGGTGVRLFGVLLKALLLCQLVPFYRSPAFWLTLVVAYLVTLAWEVTVLVIGLRQRAAGGPSTPTGR